MIINEIADAINAGVLNAAVEVDQELRAPPDNNQLDFVPLQPRRHGSDVEVQALAQFDHQLM